MPKRCREEIPGEPPRLWINLELFGHERCGDAGGVEAIDRFIRGRHVVKVVCCRRTEITAPARLLFP
jgi:hypothetical protein